MTLPIVCAETMYKAIYSVHAFKRVPEGIVKTKQTMALKCHGCTEKIVTEFRSRRWICCLNKTQQSQPRLNPIISTEIFERAQTDLVDMRNHTFGEETETVDGRKVKIYILEVFNFIQ